MSTDPEKTTTTIEIESSLGVWETRTVTYAERRALWLRAWPQQRFTDSGHQVYIAHPLNPWCLISGEGHLHVWNTDNDHDHTPKP